MYMITSMFLFLKHPLLPIPVLALGPPRNARAESKTQSDGSHWASPSVVKRTTANLVPTHICWLFLGSFIFQALLKGPKTT